MATDGSMVASAADRACQCPKTVLSQGLFQAVPPPVCAAAHSIHSPRRSHVPMSTATTTESTTGQNSSRRTTAQPTKTPTSQLERSAANRLRTTMAAVRLSFTWPGVRKTLGPEQRSTQPPECSMLTADCPRPADTNWTGAEIKSCYRLASLLDVPLVHAARNVVPVVSSPLSSWRRLPPNQSSLLVVVARAACAANAPILLPVRCSSAYSSAPFPGLRNPSPGLP